MKDIQETLRFRMGYRAGKLYVRLFPRAAKRRLIRELRLHAAMLERQRRDGMSCES